MVNLDKICKQYQNATSGKTHQVLNEISLTVDKGDSLAIVGPSGSGKSTLLNIIGTLDIPTSGDVKFNGMNVADLDDKQLSGLRNKNIGFVFQMHHLLPQLNVLENILLPVIPDSSASKMKAARERAVKLLALVGLSGMMSQYPGQLSGGECQRVAVVRALINEPEIILADEPTGSLDQQSADHVGDLLVSLLQEQNIALVVVTHSMELAKKMKKQYSLINGKLVQLK